MEKEICPECKEEFEVQGKFEDYQCEKCRMYACNSCTYELDPYRCLCLSCYEGMNHG